MTQHLTEIEAVLAWCTLINYGLLTAWVAAFWLCHDWLYEFHCRWFRLSAECFDAVHYAGMALYKIAIFMVNLVPLIAVHLVSMSGR